MVKRSEVKENFLSVTLPPKDYLVDSFPRSNLKTPIAHFCHSLEDYRNWFYQISLLFDENNKFTLVNKDEFIEPNFAEKYAFALYQNGKFNLSFHLFSLFSVDKDISKKILENNKVIYTDFGLKADELGILGIEAYCKVCAIKHKVDDALILATKIIGLDKKNIDYNKSITKAIIYSYDLLINNEEDENIKNYFKNKKQEILKIK